MGWAHRSNGYAYDSLGCCAIIGYFTGKVLDYISFNRLCDHCTKDEKNDIKKPHDCRANYQGTAKGMEPVGAVKLVANNKILKEANTEVVIFIGDNDAGCMSDLRKAGCFTIIKQSDMNHTSKGVKNALWEIKKTHLKTHRRSSTLIQSIILRNVSVTR